MDFPVQSSMALRVDTTYHTQVFTLNSYHKFPFSHISVQFPLVLYTVLSATLSLHTWAQHLVMGFSADSSQPFPAGAWKQPLHGRWCSSVYYLPLPLLASVCHCYWWLVATKWPSTTPPMTPGPGFRGHLWGPSWAPDWGVHLVAVDLLPWHPARGFDIAINSSVAVPEDTLSTFTYLWKILENHDVQRENVCFLFYGHSS